LVVDDDPGVLDPRRRYFTGQGFAVSTPPDGTGMRHALVRQAIDLVLLDLSLRGEAGFELIKADLAKPELTKSVRGAGYGFPPRVSRRSGE
jgi:DNA-binding response OmpR family regulator